jgi:hypothetical protein
MALPLLCTYWGHRSLFEYESDMVCMAKARIVPAGVVLTVQVCPLERLQSDAGGIQGIVTRLEFVTSSGDGLPTGWQSRYKTVLWRD